MSTLTTTAMRLPNDLFMRQACRTLMAPIDIYVTTRTIDDSRSSRLTRIAVLLLFNGASRGDIVRA